MPYSHVRKLKPWRKVLCSRSRSFQLKRVCVFILAMCFVIHKWRVAHAHKWCQGGRWRGLTGRPCGSSGETASGLQAGWAARSAPRVRLACSRRRHPVCSFAAGVSPGVGADVCFSRGLSGVWTGKAQISSNVSAWNRSSLLWIQGTLRNVLASYEQLWIFLNERLRRQL